MISIRRVYDPARPDEGTRFLVDRLWPRGLKRELVNATWLREVAPSNELRLWFNHDPQKWAEFQLRFARELDDRPETWQPIAEAAQRGAVTLLFGARETEHNCAVALRGYLERRMKIPNGEL
jgi:uncharacterized protein YeaO (DUF488 family)